MGKPPKHTLSLGMLSSTLDASATLVPVVLTAPLRNAHLVLMYCLARATTLVVTAPDVVFVTTLLVSASASRATLVPGARARQSCPNSRRVIVPQETTGVLVQSLVSYIVVIRVN